MMVHFPKPRFDHSASLSGQKLIILGGRNNEATVDDINVLDTVTMTWELLKQDESMPRPIPVFSHAATPVKSAISWKLFTFGGRNGPFSRRELLRRRQLPGEGRGRGVRVNDPTAARVQKPATVRNPANSIVRLSLLIS